VARPGAHRPTEAELEILRVLWVQRPPGRGLTVREIHEQLKSTRGSGYTSVLKIIQIMTRKGLLRRDAETRPQVLHAAVSEHDTKAGFMADLFERVFGGSAKELLAHALALKRTKPEDLAEIRRMIEEFGRGGGGGGNDSAGGANGRNGRGKE
jgi:predicted transcriptional regulator